MLWEQRGGPRGWSRVSRADMEVRDDIGDHHVIQVPLWITLCLFPEHRGWEGGASGDPGSSRGSTSSPEKDMGTRGASERPQHIGE